MNKSTWDAFVFVWGTWLLMQLAALGFVDRYTPRLPTQDYWYMVPAITGDPATWENWRSWLWEPHFEHRIPLPKLILVLLGRTTRELRTAAYANVLGMGLLAALMILQARRLCGRTNYSDAFFPLVLLNLGHFSTFLAGFQLVFVCSTVLSGLLLVLLAGLHPGSITGRVILVGLCVIGLPFCGSFVVPLVPCFGLWLILAARCRWKTGGSMAKCDAFILLVTAVFALGVVGSYVIGLLDHSRDDIEWSAVFRTFLQVCTASLGSIESNVAGWRDAAGRPMLAPFVIGLTLVGVMMILGTWWRNPQNRLRAEGFLLFLGAFTMLAFAIAWGRSHVGPLADNRYHYAILLVPALCCLYFIGVTHDRPALGRLLRMILFSGLCALVISNTFAGLRVGRERISRLRLVEDAIRKKIPPAQIVERYREDLIYDDSEREPEFLLERLKMLQKAKMGPYK